MHKHPMETGMGIALSYKHKLRPSNTRHLNKTYAWKKVHWYLKTIHLEQSYKTHPTRQQVPNNSTRQKDKKDTGWDNTRKESRKQPIK